MQTYYLALLLGDKYKDLHCTLVPRFESPTIANDVVTAFSALFKRQQPLQLSAGRSALFGVDQNVPATLIERHAFLMLLHLGCCHLVENHLEGRFLHTEWTHAGYTPHVTPTRRYRLPEGAVVESDLIRLYEVVRPHEIATVYTWQLATKH